MKFDVEYTDTFAGEANYCWVRRATVTMPELTHYGYTGSADGSYTRANAVFERELMRKAKSAVGITGARGRKDSFGDEIQFTPYRSNTVMFVTFRED